MSRIVFSISPVPTDSGIPSILKLDLLEYCSMLSLADSNKILTSFFGDARAAWCLIVVGYTSDRCVIVVDYTSDRCFKCGMSKMDVQYGSTLNLTDP